MHKLYTVHLYCACLANHAAEAHKSYLPPPLPRGPNGRQTSVHWRTLIGQFQLSSIFGGGWVHGRGGEQRSSLLPPGQQADQSRQQGRPRGSTVVVCGTGRHGLDVQHGVTLGAVHVLQADLADEMLPVVCGIGAVGQLDVVRVNLLGGGQ